MSNSHTVNYYPKFEFLEKDRLRVTLDRKIFEYERIECDGLLFNLPDHFKVESIEVNLWEKRIVLEGTTKMRINEHEILKVDVDDDMAKDKNSDTRRNKPLC